MPARTSTVALLCGALATAFTAVGSWVPNYWGDEAASIMSAQRSWASLANMLSTVDAVHGVYYAFLHVWISVFGAGELATRLPSSIGVGLMVAGTVVLARRFADTSTAIVGATVCVLLPRTSLMGTEARSYASVAAAAVWLTVLFVHVLDRQRASTRWWLLYGAVAGAASYLFLYLLLVVAVHGAYLALVHRGAIGGWVRGAAAAGILSAPLVVLGYSQREQLAFLSDPRYATVANVFVGQWFDPWTFAPAWALIVLLGIVLVRQHRRQCAAAPSRAANGAMLATVWLALPTAALLIANIAVPLYNARYASMSLPAAALLIAGGVTAGSRLVDERWSRVPALATTVALILALAALGSVSYVALRQSHAKDHSDWREVSAYLGEQAIPGQAVVFDRTQEEVRDPRLALRLYPAGFEDLRDVGLVTPWFATNGLWDVTAPPSALTDLPREVWAVETITDHTPPDVTYLQSRGFVVERAETFTRTIVYLMVRS